ncbi:MAG: NUDIX domain-containing protein [Gammaproteobacteria bacterium]|nr:NUDIX domain-containing protein [Gammaproteobacteria bacterium]NIR84804.1 NUDIX domain-containing protein [Gammaproteobacteria bacterium]NIR91518.1 NUDIX domain-containing protein [Gammaproteobacteria bacterium]NIU05851.1 NUDIX domain-containing protein [Gammaproteobacteria bacterium]NIV76706.1 NUDIX domain-containing protein [Gammaproteobacteria bacterium]
MPRVLSAGVVVVRWFDEEPRYLLLRAYRYWDFPKGEVARGEDPIRTAVREVEEETTLSDLAFRWGSAYRETPPYRGGKVARYYVAESPRGEVHLPVSPELARPEHHEFRWLAYRAARERLAERVRPILDWAHALVQSGNDSSGGNL